MGTAIDIAKSINGHFGINLGRLHRRVPQEFLHDADIRATGQYMGGEGMPKRVGRNKALEVSPPRGGAQN